MTDRERVDVLKELEKTFFKSKKFLAWLISQVLLSALAGEALYLQRVWSWSLASFMFSIVVTMGTSTMWIIGKQAAVDGLLRGLALKPGTDAGTVPK